MCQIADYQAKRLNKSQNFPRQLSDELWCAFWGDTPENFIHLHPTHLTHLTPDERPEGLAGNDLASGSSSASG